MAFKFVTFCALLAVANAGGLSHPVTYTQVQSAGDETHQYHHQGQDGAHHHVHYVPAFAKTVHIAAPVHSAPIYSAPALKYVTYGAPSYLRSLAYNEGPSSTPSTPAEETTIAETTTTESSTAEAESTVETTHASRSAAEPEPTQASYQQQTVTSSGYNYEAPSVSSTPSSHHEAPSTQDFVKYQTSFHHAAGHHLSAPSVVKYEVPAQTVVKYAAAPAPQHLVHYTSTPVQTVYHKTAAPQSVHVKYLSPEPAVYTSFGEHPPAAVYSHHSAQPATTTVHHSYPVPQYSSVPSAPSQVTYIAPAPAVYTKYGVEQPTSQPAINHAAPAPNAYIKYNAPAPFTAHTTFAVPAQHSVEEKTTLKLINYEAPETSTKSQSNEENKESVEVEAPESAPATQQPASRAYLPPSSQQTPVGYQYTGHVESARSQSNEQNYWSTDGAASHVRFKGFGTSFAY